MKYLWGTMAMALCLCAGSAQAASDYQVTPEIASAYFEVVDGIAQDHSRFLLKVGDEMNSDGYEYVFWDARLVDFDHDTVPELFFIYDPEGVSSYSADPTASTNQYQVWGWNGSKAYPIASGSIEPVLDSGAIFPALLGVLEEDGKCYIPFMTHAADVEGHNIIEFYTVVNGQWKNVPEKRMYAEADMRNDDFYKANATIGGKSVSSEAFQARWIAVNENTASVWNWSGTDTTCDAKFYAFKDAVNLPISLKSHVDTVQIDGQSVQLQFYNVGDSNYVRLRDLAAVMKDTQKPFDVQWKANMVMVVKDTPYMGSRSAAKEQTNTARRAVQLIHFLRPEQYAQLQEMGYATSEIPALDVRVLNIQDENYVKLRDIGRYVNFAVEWDAATNQVIINSRANYTQA